MPKILVAPAASLSLLVALTLGLPGRATSAEAESAVAQKTQGKQLTIGFALAEYQHWAFAEMKRAAEAEADALGVSLVPMDAHYMSISQPDHIEMLVDRRVDGILVNPVPSAPSALLGPAIDSAVGAGIPVVEVFGNLEPNKAIAAVGMDVALGARLAARFVIDKLGGKGSVLFLDGFGPTAARAAFEHELQGSGVKIVAIGRTGTPSRSNSKQVMAELIREHPRFDAAVGVNDNVTLGFIDAMVEAGIDPTRKATLTWIGSPDAQRAIDAGQLGAALDPQTGEQARQALRILVDNIRAKKLPATRQVLVAPTLMTKASARDRRGG